MTEPRKPLVHLELHTANLPRALEFYSRACGWAAEPVGTGAGSYLTLGLGGGCGGGAVECETERALWLPYAEVDEIGAATERAEQLGGRVLLSPREGPAGWRSVVAAPEGAELAFWQPKR